MKVVLDTNVLISATLWSNSVANKLLFKLIEQESKIFISEEILSEYGRVLIRDFDHSEEQALQKRNNLSLLFTIVYPVRKITAVKEDAQDDKIIECGVESLSDYIVSYDNHLLKLKKFMEIKIMSPDEILKIL